MSVDVHRFQRLVGQARTVERVEAVPLFDQALALWRGEAFATLDTPWVNSVRATLDSLRLAAELDRNAVALDGGQHAALLGQLAASAAKHPLDERLAGQLMLALSRCGRQADALEAYRQLRQRLVEELGVDPGKPLQELLRQILAADPALTSAQPVTRSAQRPTRSPVPRQLPAPLRSFTGRAQELAELDALLTAAGNQPAAVVVSAISGTAGVGKPNPGI